MRKTILLLLAIAVLVETATALTVDEAVRQAADNNLGLRGENLKLAQKADEKEARFNRLYPSASADSTLMRLNQVNMDQMEQMWPLISNGTPFSAISDGLTEGDHWMLSLGVNLDLVLNPAVFRGMAQTVLDYDAAKLSRDSADARLERDVRKAFYLLLALHEATEVFDSQLKTAADRYRLAKLYFDAGLGSEISALQAQVSYENRKPALADQRLNEENARSGFKALLNIPEASPLELEGSLDVSPEVLKALGEMDVETTVRRYLDGRWDVKSAQKNAASKENLSALRSDALWPSLILGYSVDPSVQAPFKPSTWNDPSLSRYNWAQTNGGLSLTLSWKIDGFIPGSETELAIRDSRRQAEQARLGIEQARRAGENEIRSLVGKLKESASAFDALSLAMGLAERSAKLAEDGFRAGTQSLTEAQDADLVFRTARLQYLNEELALQSTLADLDYALASGREGWLHE